MSIADKKRIGCGQMAPDFDQPFGNAIKHTEKGHVQLDIWEDPNRPDWIFAEVTDEGRVPKEHRERIFELFGMVQYDSYHEEHRMDSGSTGLGLSIARELARVLGGFADAIAKGPNLFWKCCANLE